MDEFEQNLQEARSAIADLCAQLMRIAAGAGDCNRMLEAFDRFSAAIAKPGGLKVVWQGEAHDALRFTRDVEERSNAVEDAVDHILVGALRTVASRLEGNHVQESRSRHQVFDGMRLLEEGRAEAWKNRRPITAEELDRLFLPHGLSDRMRRALDFYADPKDHGPGAFGLGTIAALARRELLEPGEGPFGHVMTKLGREVRAEAQEMDKRRRQR